jgi:hypothetical protein
MKRLVDESTDELTRSLLSAGIEHHPPPGNQGRVIVALGAGGAFGLLSSNAFAWLGTTAGKVTAVSVVAVGVAGAVFSVVPSVEDKLAEGSRVTASLRAPSPEAATPRVIADEPSEPVVATSGVEASDDAERVAGATERRSVAKGRKLTAAAAHERRAARAKKRAASKSGSTVVASADAPEAASTRDGTSLDAEVRLVDNMHWAARRNDRAALERLVTTYRSSFPGGQLEAEVAEFAARLDHPDEP